MLQSIIQIFGKSPFAPLQSHMDKVDQCVTRIPLLFESIHEKDYLRAEKIAIEISEYEHLADLTKNDIRNHLPKSLFLPIDRTQLLEIVTIQDSIADKAEDLAVLCTLKNCEMPSCLQGDFTLFLKKNLEAFVHVRQIIMAMHELLESSFGGIEAEKVKTMVDDVAYFEHEADLIQRRLLKSLLNAENELSYASFYLWQKILEVLGAISNLSEKLANRIRMTLELK